MKKVYLSSTFEDLKAHRDAVYRTLRQIRCDVVSMEDYVASGQRPLDKCLDDVAGCDAYVGLFAWRYGFVPEGQQHAITELEWRQAEREGLPCLMFLLRDGTDWPPAFVDADPTAITDLRERLKQRYTVQFFGSVDELARAVATAGANLFDRDRDAEPSTEEIGLYRNCIRRLADELDHDIRLYAVASVALVVLALGTLTLAIALLDGPRQWLAAGGGMLFASSCPFPLVTWRATRKKKAVFDGYAEALGSSRPAREAVARVRRFVEGQLAATQMA